MSFNLIGLLVFVAVVLGVLALNRAQARPAPGGSEGNEESGREQKPAERSRGPSFMDRWEQMALQAGLPWKRNLYYFVAGTALALAGALALLGQPFAALLTALAGAAGPHMFVRQQQLKRQARFSAQLPQALFLAASVLRAGGTLLQAVDAIASEMPGPMGEEFKRIQQAMRLQVPAHEAMADAQARVGVPEFAAVVVAARITAEVGGNLAHVYEQVARSIVDAQNARRTVLAFTTEGRMSANLIAAMPFVVLGILQLVSPGYFGILFASWVGRLVLAACLGTIVLGWVAIRRMVDIRPY